MRRSEVPGLAALGAVLRTLPLVLGIAGAGLAAAGPDKGPARATPQTPAPPSATASLEGIGLSLEPLPEVQEGPAPHRITWHEALQLALQQNLELALAHAEEGLAQTRSRRALARLVPELGFGAGVGRTNGRVQGSFGALRDVEFDTDQGRLSLGVELNLGERIFEILATRNESDEATYEVLDTRRRLLLRVAELYSNLLVGRTGLQIAHRLESDGEDLLRIAEARARSGLGRGADVARARARLARNRQQRVIARKLWETTSTRLAVVLRSDPSVRLLPDVDRLAPHDLAPVMAESDAARRARHRSDVEATRSQEAAARRRLEAAWWDLAGPELSAELRATAIGESTNDLQDRNHASVFLGWTLSLAKLATVAERRAERRLAALRATRQEERAVGEAHGALQELRALGERLPLAWQELGAARESQRINLAQFRSGTANALEVLEAEDDLAEARLAVARSIVDYNLAQMRLLAVVGALQQAVAEERDGSRPPR